MYGSVDVMGRVLPDRERGAREDALVVREERLPLAVDEEDAVRVGRTAPSCQAALVSRAGAASTLHGAVGSTAPQIPFADEVVDDGRGAEEVATG